MSNLTMEEQFLSTIRSAQTNRDRQWKEALEPWLTEAMIPLESQPEYPRNVIEAIVRNETEACAVGVEGLEGTSVGSYGLAEDDMKEKAAAVIRARTVCK